MNKRNKALGEVAVVEVPARASESIAKSSMTISANKLEKIIEIPGPGIVIGGLLILITTSGPLDSAIVIIKVDDNDILSETISFFKSFNIMASKISPIYLRGIYEDPQTYANYVNVIRRSYQYAFAFDSFQFQKRVELFIDNKTSYEISELHQVRYYPKEREYRRIEY
ncbi:MAG TPA: hypothetical protein ENG63_06955 [Candidatus Desulfofervidus auxilii]|uniref:Uncharacterized protein n=1 Tax=Desulfofervidus auxilii TaxID=1621989 RepID=A0A7C0U328_DESA2|nr:hypothetical protein [Candidatus Desulfofervidus auxilii]